MELEAEDIRYYEYLMKEAARTLFPPDNLVRLHSIQESAREALKVMSELSEKEGDAAVAARFTAMLISVYCSGYVQRQLEDEAREAD